MFDLATTDNVKSSPIHIGLKISLIQQRSSHSCRRLNQEGKASEIIPDDVSAWAQMQ